jgi:type II secretory pathway predicted ATPase ExeA
LHLRREDDPLAAEAVEDDDRLWPKGVEPTKEFLSTLDFVRNNRGNLFVTGRAGTGKSTLLRTIVRSLANEVVIGAPTGIAAFIVGGQTLSEDAVAYRSLLLPMKKPASGRKAMRG